MNALLLASGGGEWPAGAVAGAQRVSSSAAARPFHLQLWSWCSWRWLRHRLGGLFPDAARVWSRSATLSSKRSASSSPRSFFVRSCTASPAWPAWQRSAASRSRPIYFEVLTTIALIIGLVAVNLFQPGVGMHVDFSMSIRQASALSRTNPQAHHVPFLMNIIPNTFVGAFTKAMSCRFFHLGAVRIRTDLARHRRQTANDLIEVAAQMIFGVVAIVMWAAPIGAFGAIAFTVGKFGAARSSRSASCREFLHHVPGLYLCGSMADLPWCGFSLLEIHSIYPRRAVDRDRDHVVGDGAAAHDRQARGLGCEESVVGLVIPTGYSFNLDGTCLYLATAAVFSAQATDTPLPLEQQMACW